MTNLQKRIAFLSTRNVDIKTVLDIGSGSGYKLIKYFNHLNPTGLEIEPTLSWLRNKYPDNNWVESNFYEEIGNFDLIICSDVIEHIDDPDTLVNFINKIGFKFLVISTPERNEIQRYQKGYLWDGPPLNLSHYREWTLAEFNNYISQFFNVKEQLMTKNKAEHASLCQVVVATGGK